MIFIKMNDQNHTPHTVSQTTISSSFGFVNNEGDNKIGVEGGVGGSTPNPDFKRMQCVTFFAYFCHMIVSLIVLIAFIIVYTSISPSVDFHETGNSWTFILLFVTCALIFAISLAVVLIFKCTQFVLKWKHITPCDILFTFLLCAVACVAIGALEYRQDRSQCYKPDVICTKHKAPMVITSFGKYIHKHCGIVQDKAALEASLVRDYSSTNVKVELDAEKCEGAKSLQTAIYCMYILPTILLMMTLINGLFGLSSWRLRGTPEFL